MLNKLAMDQSLSDSDDDESAEPFPEDYRITDTDRGGRGRIMNKTDMLLREKQGFAELEGEMEGDAHKGSDYDESGEVVRRESEDDESIELVNSEMRGEGDDAMFEAEERFKDPYRVPKGYRLVKNEPLKWKLAV